MKNPLFRFLLIATAVLAGCSEQPNSPTMDNSQPSIREIRNGQPIPSNTIQTKSVVALYYRVSETTIKLCSGTIISKETTIPYRTAVLTAAHCVAAVRSNPSLLHMYVGADTRVGMPGPTLSDVVAQAISVYPTYQGSTYNPDLAVVRFQTFGNGCANITFTPPSLGSISSYALNYSFLGIGWGDDGYGNYFNKLQGNFLLNRYLSSTWSGGNLSSQYLSSTWRPGRVKNGIIEVIPNTANNMICGGDSGSPIFDRNGGLAGVASFSDSAVCNSATRGYFVSAYHFGGWIQSQVNALLTSTHDP